MSLVAPTLQAFFTDRLVRQRRASPRTIASYRDTLRLLLAFAESRIGRPPSSLAWDDLDADFICAFLDHLEADRGNGARTRNVRLTAIRSLFRHAALCHPEHADIIQRVLAIPHSESSGRPSRSSPRQRRTPSSARPMSPAGKVDGIGRCSSSPSKPACGSPNSSVSTAQTSFSAPVRTSVAKARGESSGRCPSRPRPGTFSRPGWPKEAGVPTTPSFPRERAGVLAEMRSSAQSPFTRPPQRHDAHLFRPRSCTPTCSDTAAPCRCCKQGWTPRSSRSG
jgi:hypothetical protein